MTTPFAALHESANGTKLPIGAVRDRQALELRVWLGAPPHGLQNFYERTTLYPATRLGGRTLRDFYLRTSRSSGSSARDVNERNRRR